jgi:hypothetical protein
LLCSAPFSSALRQRWRRRIVTAAHRGLEVADGVAGDAHNLRPQPRCAAEQPASGGRDAHRDSRPWLSDGYARSVRVISSATARIPPSLGWNDTVVGRGRKPPTQGSGEHERASGSAWRLSRARRTRPLRTRPVLRFLRRTAGARSRRGPSCSGASPRATRASADACQEQDRCAADAHPHGRYGRSGAIRTDMTAKYQVEGPVRDNRVEFESSSAHAKSLR